MATDSDGKPRQVRAFTVIKTFALLSQQIYHLSEDTRTHKDYLAHTDVILWSNCKATTSASVGGSAIGDSVRGANTLNV